MYFPPGSFPASSSRHERFKRLLGEQFWDWQTNTLNWSRLKGKSGFQIDASFTCFEKIFPNMLVRGHCLHTKQVLHRFCNYIFLFFFKSHPRSVPFLILPFPSSLACSFGLLYTEHCISDPYTLLLIGPTKHPMYYPPPYLYLHESKTWEQVNVLSLSYVFKKYFYGGLEV